MGLQAMGTTEPGNRSPTCFSFPIAYNPSIMTATPCLTGFTVPHIILCRTFIHSHTILSPSHRLPTPIIS